jgi:predicted HicB family RNase H-like nuclease
MTKFILTLSKELHKEAKHCAIDKGITLNALIVKAIEKIIKEGK